MRFRLRKKAEGALAELERLLDEEFKDGWDYNRNDDVRNILSYGERVGTGRANAEGENEKLPRSYEGGHWRFLPDAYGRAWEQELNLDGEKGARAKRIVELLGQLTAEELTEIALSLSLCPIHLGDYASCFDDDEEECRAVRAIHPSHDT